MELATTTGPALSRTSTAAERYVATLATEPGRRGMRSALALAASVLVPGLVPSGGGAAARWRSAASIPWGTINANGISRLREELLARAECGQLAAATVNRSLAAVRGTLRHAWLAGEIEHETLGRCLAQLKALRSSTIPAGRHVDRGELSQVFKALARDPRPVARRDAALVALLSIGLRRAEVVALDLADVDRSTGGLRVRGKGGRERVAWLTNGSRAAVEAWIEARGTEPGALFHGTYRHGGRRSARITAAGLRDALRRRCQAAEVTGFSPHDLRRTFAGEALDAGVDLPTVQAIMGHASPSTTARYDRRPDETRRSAMRAVAVPFVPARG
jgi:integrase